MVIFISQGGAEHNIPVVVSKISKEQRGKYVSVQEHPSVRFQNDPFKFMATFVVPMMA